MKLRPYQATVIDEARRRWRDRPILCMPTGSGKTVVACSIIQAAVDRGKRVLFLVHRRELITQAAARLDAWNIDTGIIAAGFKERRELPVQVASIQTLKNRELPWADVVFVDECHHAKAKTWGEVIDGYPDAALIGLTATPFRLDGRPLGDIFGCIIEGTCLEDLCNEGTLVEPTIYTHPSGEHAADDVKVSHGDYQVGELGEAMSNPHLLGDVVAHWQERAEGRRTVVFATNIAHSKRLTSAFLQAGVAAEHIDGSTPKDERDAVLGRLADGHTSVVSNCMLLGEGWDLPALEVAVLARPTHSLGLHLQQIGRIMRAAPGKDGALVLDHAGNFVRHGHPFERIQYSLVGKIKKEAADLIATKSCPVCYMVLPAAIRVCEGCGHVFASEAREHALEERSGTLIEFKKPDKEGVYRDLVARANSKRYSLGWARHQYRERFGVWPRGSWVNSIEEQYTCLMHDWETRNFGGRNVQRCTRCFRTGTA